MILRKLSIAFLLLAVLCVVGCDGGAKGRVAVSGTVTLDGEPIEKGSVQFVPEAGTGPATIGAIVDGKYSIPANKSGMPGKYEVLIQGVKLVKGVTRNADGEEIEIDNQAISILPAKYDPNNRDREKLYAELTKGKNVVDFALTSDKEE